MFSFVSLLDKAEYSRFYRWLLNYALYRVIPFNKPHRFKIIDIKKHSIRVCLPYRRRNLNHIRSLHACAMATLAEFTSGLLLLRQLDSKEYRIILKDIAMSYCYQGKMDAYATFSLSEKWIKDCVIMPLEEEDAVEVICEIKIYDIKENHLATGNITWQVKAWNKVRTKL